MSEQKVRAALVTEFLDNTFLPAGDVAYENFKFTPPVDRPWGKVTFVPNPRSVATLGPTGTDLLTGFLQIDLNYPENDGSGAVDTKATAIGNVFTVGKRLIYQGQEVVIKSCGRSQGRTIGAYYRVSVTVMFYAFLNR